MAKFIRIIREKEMKELLLNVDHISKIEVQYAVKGHDPNDRSGYVVSLKQGAEDPKSIRIYRFTIAGEEYLLAGVTGDPVVRVIQEIYENAIRTPEPHERPTPGQDI
ncbi:MAG: hypothetical protein JSS49_27415 [Planctomycetes bacterium]|nr:hypothetical protein [Planctomycetota bacterium]